MRHLMRRLLNFFRHPKLVPSPDVLDTKLRLWSLDERIMVLQRRIEDDDDERTH